MEGALEAHCSGDAGKGLIVDGGWQISAKEIGDAGPESKHKQEKTKNNNEPTK